MKFKICPNRKLYNNYHTKLTMGSLKEKPRRGKQGKKFKEEDSWEQSAEISKEHIIEQSWKKGGAHSRGNLNFVRTENFTITVIQNSPWAA